MADHMTTATMTTSQHNPHSSLSRIIFVHHNFKPDFYGWNHIFLKQSDETEQLW